jgi:hypothetical protein
VGGEGDMGVEGLGARASKIEWEWVFDPERPISSCHCWSGTWKCRMGDVEGVHEYGA